MSVITERNATLPAATSASVFAPAPAADDLAKTVGDLLSQGPTDAFAFEHALAGLIRAAREDRSALREALQPVIKQGLAPRLDHGRLHDVRDYPLATPLRQLYALAVNAAWRPTSVHRYGYPGYPRDFALVRLLRRLELSLDRAPGMDPYALRTPADILTLRLAELATRVGDPTPVELVSTPTDPDGWIEPEMLVARIAEAESAGWQPWPLDFDQALLRLPDNPGPATARAAHQLVSPAGRRLAGWLRGGRPTLPKGRDLVADPESIAGKPLRSPRVHPLITLADPALANPLLADPTLADQQRTGSLLASPLLTSPPPPGPLLASSLLNSSPLNSALLAGPQLNSTAFAHSPSTLIHLLRRGWYPPRPLADGSCWTACWPALLPGHPDLISIAVAWHPHHPDAHGAPCPAPVLTELAQEAQAEACGSDTYAAIARALTSRSPAKRMDAAQAFATLAVSGAFDAGRFAAALAAFATRTDRQVLRSVVPALQHVLTSPATAHVPQAVQNVAAAHAAAVADRALASAIGKSIVGWLPAILPPALDQPLPYTSHLLNLAADALTAARTPKQPPRKPSPTATAAIDALTRLANRPGRSAVSDAASALLAVLAPAT